MIAEYGEMQSIWPASMFVQSGISEGWNQDIIGQTPSLQKIKFKS